MGMQSLKYNTVCVNVLIWGEETNDKKSCTYNIHTTTKLKTSNEPSLQDDCCDLTTKINLICTIRVKYLINVTVLRIYD